MKVLDIKVDDISLSEAITKIKEAINRNQNYKIVTPNLEIITQAQEDQKLAKILNNADLAIPDGAGLRLGGIKNTTPGVVLMQELISLAAAKRNLGVGLYGGRNNSAKLALEKLQEQNPNLKGWAMAAPKLQITNYKLQIGDKDAESEYQRVVTKIKQNNTKIIFIALGAPKQEYFMDQLKTNIVLMVVGGSFDEISGLVKPAPDFVTKLGLKWLWRLIFQPWRLPRQLRLIKFLYYLFLKKIMI